MAKQWLTELRWDDLYPQFQFIALPAQSSPKNKPKTKQCAKHCTTPIPCSLEWFNLTCVPFQSNPFDPFLSILVSKRYRFYFLFWNHNNAYLTYMNYTLFYIFNQKFYQHINCSGKLLHWQLLTFCSAYF